MLSILTGIPVDNIKILTLSFGKPVFKLLHFNHSSKKNAWLYGFSKKAEIGIDLEKIHSFIEIEGIVSLYFTEEEKKCYMNSNAKIEKFFELWTLKEAKLKCYGLPFIDNYRKEINAKTFSFKFSQYQISVASREELSNIAFIYFDVDEESQLALRGFCSS